MSPILLLLASELFLTAVLLFFLTIYSKNVKAPKKSQVKKDIDDIKEQINS